MFLDNLIEIRMVKMADKISFEDVNTSLVDVFNNAMWIEEASLRDSEFSDITLKDMHIIAAIGGQGEVAASKLAHIVHVTPSTMTSSIDKLFRKGYVERQRDDVDRRLVLIVLTAKGQAVCRSHDAFHRGLTHTMFSDLDSEESNTVQNAIFRLQDYLKNLVD